MVKRLVGREVVTKLRHYCAVEHVQLKQVGPSLQRAFERLARGFELVQLVIGQRQVVLHLWRLRRQVGCAAKRPQRGFQITVLAVYRAE